MASVTTGSNTKSGKLNTELSLVPFIDLLSTLVLFLLLSAVWTQMGSLPASVDSKGVSQNADMDTKKLTVSLAEKKIILTWPTILSSQGLPASAESLEKVLPLVEKLIKEQKLSSASVAGEDSVPYGQVVTAIDKLKRTGLASVGLSTN